MPPTKLWVGIKICTFTYVQPEILCAQLLLHPLMDFVHTHTHSDQYDMEMTVKTGFSDAASFTWVIGLCHGEHPCPTDTFLVLLYISREVLLAKYIVVFGSSPELLLFNSQQLADIDQYCLFVAHWIPNSYNLVLQLVLKDLNFECYTCSESSLGTKNFFL